MYKLSYGLLLVPPFLWATMLVVGYVVLGQVPPATLTLWTWLVAALSLLPFFCLRLQQNIAVVRQEFWPLFFFALLGAAGFQYFLFAGLLRASAISASVLSPTIPIMVACLSWPLLKERLGTIQIIGVALAFAGAGWIATAGHWKGFHGIGIGSGELLILTANLSMAGYTIMLRLFPSRLEPMSFMAIVALFGALQAIPFSVLETGLLRGLEISLNFVYALLYIGIVNYSLAYVFWNIAVKKHGATTTAIFLYLIPVFGSIMSVIFLGEDFRHFHMVGIVAIFLGLYMSLHVKTNVAEAGASE